MVDFQQLLLPIINLAKPIFNFVLDVASSVILPVITFFLGLGEVMFAKIFILCVLTLFLYKAATILIGSPKIAFMVSFLVALLGVRLTPASIFTVLISGWYVFAVLGAFIAFTLAFRTAWWQRRAVMLILMAIFIGYWYFYDPNKNYIIMAIILLIFLIFDNTIHRMIAPLRGNSERREMIRDEIKVKEKEIDDLIAAGVNMNSSTIKNLQSEINGLVREESKL